MPLFVTFLLNVFTGLAAWLAKYVSQKIAVAVPLVLAVTALSAALYVALRTLYGSVLVSLAGIHPSFAIGVSVVMPPHTASLITAYVTFWSLTELYKWKVNILSLWGRAA